MNTAATATALYEGSSSCEWIEDGDEPECAERPSSCGTIGIEAEASHYEARRSSVAQQRRWSGRRRKRRQARAEGVEAGQGCSEDCRSAPHDRLAATTPSVAHPPSVLCPSCRLPLDCPHELECRPHTCDRPPPCPHTSTHRCTHSQPFTHPLLPSVPSSNTVPLAPPPAPSYRKRRRRPPSYRSPTVPSRSLLSSLLLLLLACWLPPPLAVAATVDLPVVDTTCLLTYEAVDSSQCIQDMDLLLDRSDHLCASVSTSERIERFNRYWLFGDANHTMPLGDFLLGGRNTSSLVKSSVAHKCLQADTTTCRSGVRSIADSLRVVLTARGAFSRVLARFDCLPGNDTSSATRPFSPNARCKQCMMWYTRWLTAQQNFWGSRPCIQWCYAAQLACPHLATSRAVDYAGHPTFQCADLHILSLSASSDCSCVHPCDISGIVPTQDDSAAPGTGASRGTSAESIGGGGTGAVEEDNGGGRYMNAIANFCSNSKRTCPAGAVSIRSLFIIILIALLTRMAYGS